MKKYNNGNELLRKSFHVAIVNINLQDLPSLGGLAKIQFPKTITFL
jgi:hypothetical protein